MLAFLFLGEGVINFLGIDVNSFAVAGSIVMFFMALEMILGITLFKQSAESMKTATIVPVAFPLIAGAGSMTSIISLRAEFAPINIAIAILVNMALVYHRASLDGPHRTRLGRRGHRGVAEGLRHHPAGHRREAVLRQCGSIVPSPWLIPVVIHTDGGASGNPGPGGYGAILQWGGRRKELTAGYRMTTNNRMELLAVIVALEALKRDGTECWVVSDSKYVIDAVEKGWVFNWEKKGFKGKKNPDLWQRFLKVYRRHKVRFDWVKGHAGNPMNERADHLAVTAYQKKGLLIDDGYEATV